MIKWLVVASVATFIYSTAALIPPPVEFRSMAVGINTVTARAMESETVPRAAQLMIKPRWNYAASVRGSCLFDIGTGGAAQLLGSQHGMQFCYCADVGPRGVARGWSTETQSMESLAGF